MVYLWSVRFKKMAAKKPFNFKPIISSLGGGGNRYVVILHNVKSIIGCNLCLIYHLISKTRWIFSCWKKTSYIYAFFFFFFSPKANTKRVLSRDFFLNYKKTHFWKDSWNICFFLYTCIKFSHLKVNF